MADKGRDLKVSILSDVAQFDATKPADDLDELARAAGLTADELGDLESDMHQVDDAFGAVSGSTSRVRDELDQLARSGSKLDRVSDDAKAAGNGVDRLGDDAKATAAKVDSAFDKIGRASSKSAKDVKDDTGKMGHALDEFKDEAGSSGREAAASFGGGFDDVTDFVQETAANALGGLGPVGAAAGVAAAAGIGIMTAQLEKANERIQDVRQSLTDLGTSDATTELDRVNEALTVLRDNGDLEGLRRSLTAAGVSWQDYLDAMVHGGPLVDEVKRKLYDLGNTGQGLGSIYDSNARGAQSAWDALDQYRQGAELAEGDIAAMKDATEGLTDAQGNATDATQAWVDVLPAGAEAVKAMGEALAGFSDPLAAYTETLAAKEDAERETAEKTAAATKDQKDSWEDYAKSVDVSVDEYLDALEKQVTAQEEWAGNITKLAKRGVDEGVLAELERLGPEGAPLIAKLTGASDAELARMVALFKRKGTDSTDQLAAAVRGGKTGVSTAVQDIRDDMKRRLSPQINVPVGVDGPSSGDLAAVRSQIKSALNGITVTVDAIARQALGRTVP